MKNLRIIAIFLFSLFVTCSHGQGSKPIKLFYLTDFKGTPTSQPGQFPAAAVSFSDKKVWIKESAVSAWKTTADTNIINFCLRSVGSGMIGPQGPQGPQGPAGPGATIIIGTTSTLPAGSTATVTNSGTSTNAVLNFGIPKGSDGVGGSGGSVWLPFITVQPSNVDDADALQRAVDEAYVNGKQIQLAGVYKLSKGIKIPKDIKYLSITGWAELVATNQNVWTFFYSDLPASNPEAEGVYTMRRMKFSNLVLKGQSQKQSGFDLMASEGVEYSFIWGYELNTLNTATFALRTFVNYNEANGCIDGLKLISGEGRWTGATSSNSCSNGSTINSFRGYAATNTNSILTIKDVSNTVLDYTVIEGFKVNTGIDYVATSTTSTGLDSRRLHYECAQQATTAVVKIRSSTMSHYISAPAFGKQSTYVLLEASSGYPNVTISHISSNRIFWNGLDKIFKNSGGNWTFEDCDDPLRQTSELVKMYSGTPVGTNGGPNSVRITLPIAR